MLDPDALGGTFTHWLIYRMPPGITSLADVPPGAAEGVNDFGRRGYGGPCPPRGAAHHYHFVVLALDTWPGPGSRSEAVGSGLPHQRSRAGQGRTGRHLPARLSGPCQRQRARFGQQERGPSLSSDADHRVQSISRWQARVTAVIWSPNLGVFAVSAAGVLCAFPAWRTRYLDSVSAARLAQIPFSLLFLELRGYSVNTVQRHVNAADVLVRCGVDRDGSR